jgi:RNA polymerase sigma factor (sigma-70 family)
VATAIMYADWRYDETRVGKTGMKKTKYSYRNQCAIWAIKTYITNKYKSSTKVQSIFAMKDDEEISLDVEDSKQQQPIDILMDNEYKTILQNNLEEMLNNELLSEKQKEQIKMYYYDDMTLSEIGKQFNISREAVRQNIKRGISIIQTYDTV